MIYLVSNHGELGELESNGEYKHATVDQVIRYFQNKDELQVDSESDGLCPYQNSLVTLQLGDRKNQFVIDLRFQSAQPFKPLLEDKLCLLQNAKHDYKFLKRIGITLENIYDTMLAECVIYNGYGEKFGYALDDIYKRHLGLEISKDPRKDFGKLQGGPLPTRLIKYAAEDVTRLADVRDAQKKLIDKFDLQTAVDLENKAVKALGDIELNGMYMDTQQWSDLAAENRKEYQQSLIEMDELVLNMDLGYHANGEQDLFRDEVRPLSINYGSPPQTLDMLRRAGLPVNSTNANTLEQYNHHEIVKKLTEVRGLKTSLSRYGDSFLDYINPKTGRIHTDFWQMKNTFRLGSSDPNIQNIPRDNRYRNCFKPRPGYKWISIDYSGQEMRLMADFSKESHLINAMNEGKDPHCFVGSMMFEKEITKDDPLRQDAKIINFGKPYGMGPPKLSRKLGISESDAEARLKLHERKFPSLDRYLKKQGEAGKTQGYVITNPIHRGRRWFPKMKIALEERQRPNSDWSKIYRVEGSVEREAMNLSIQGSGAVMMKESLVEIREILKGYDGYLINTVHDESNMEVREDQAEEVARVAAEAMSKIGNKYVRHVKMPVDVKITDHWEK